MKNSNLNKKLFGLLLASGIILTGNGQEKVADEVVASKDESSKIVKIDEILRQQYELEADLLYKEAETLMSNKKYEEASGKLDKVVIQLSKVSKSDEKILAKIKDAELKYSNALKLYAVQLIVEAKKNQNEETQTGYEKALVLLKKARNIDGSDTSKIDSEIEELNKLIKINEHVEKVGEHRLNDEFVNDPQKGSIANKILYDRAKIYYSQRRFGQARSSLEQILVNQPFNHDAVNLLYKVNKKIHEAGKIRRETSYQEYIDEVEWKWSDPINIYSADTEINSETVDVDNNSKIGKIYNKLQIVIPKVRFDDRDLDFVVDFIKRTTRDLDEEGEGLNVIVSVDIKGNDSAPVEEDIGFEDDPLADELDALADAGAESGSKKINLDADDIPVGEVIKYICEQVGLKYKVEEYAVIIGDNASFQTLETEFYSISAGLLDIVSNKEAADIVDGLGGGDEGGEGNQFKDYFMNLGISFPPGAQMKFVQQAMRLVVTNTPDNHRKLEEVLRQIGIETPQVSVESKFIEIEHTNVEEFGFEWIIGRPDSIDQRPHGIDHQLLGANDLTSPNYTNPNQATGPSADSGIRGINTVLGNPLGAQAGVSLILSDYIFQGMIRALEQESSLDTLSAPQVTAVSGKTAIIRIVDERYFPESFEPPEVSEITAIGSAPTYGEPRDVGIVLEVTPTVEPDGYTLSLDLRPQVLEFEGYDTAFNSEILFTIGGLAGGDDGVQVGRMPVVYSMPLLTARTVETRVTIWDGETIMLGGLIREEVTSVNDEVPYLSDIPFIGELFKSKGSESVKTNLLMFVTARLIDPAGLPKKPNVDKGLPDFKRL